MKIHPKWPIPLIETLEKHRDWRLPKLLLREMRKGGLRIASALFIASGLHSLQAETNQAPIAYTQSVMVVRDVPKTIQLQAQDPDGSPITYSLGTLPVHGSLSGSAPNLVYTPAAGFTGGDAFTFKAGDGQLVSPPTAISINVLSPGATGIPPVTSLTSPASGKTYVSPAQIPLSASASDADGTITQVSFFSGDTKIGGSLVPPYQMIWSNVPPGTYVLTSKAFDNQSLRTFSAPVVVTVTGVPVNNPPPPPAQTLFTLIVNSGSGSGVFASGAIVQIVAQPAPSGMVFDQWVGSPVANPTAASTSLVMPSASANVTATYKYLPPVPPTLPANPILFVAQIPIGDDFTTIGSAFGNHRPGTESVGRGGDLYIRYPDGSLKNLTAAAGFGTAAGFQGAGSIAVRDPAVHWSGQKALFSMAIGAPTNAFQAVKSLWQIYEITGFLQGESPTISKVANQPSQFNNIAPCYGTDGRIIFTSDRTRNGQMHLYPQLDEYELSPTVSGLWSLDPSTGDLKLLTHTPSGAFTPSIDSFGRVLFTRWDHLQRDQEADIDNGNLMHGQPLTYGTFNVADESPGASLLPGVRIEVFPEPRFAAGFANGHTFNIFFPWTIREDGTGEELINHVGRHELSGYIPNSFTNDSNLTTFYNSATRYNTNFIYNALHVKEDPANPGRYLATDAPEFTTHSSGQIFAMNAPESLPADQIRVDYLTHPATKNPTSQPAAGHSGHYREPLPLSNGTLAAIHADGTDLETMHGVGSAYSFRLKLLWKQGAYYVPWTNLTAGITKSVSFYFNGSLVNYSGQLWELNPVEVRPRPVPGSAPNTLDVPESQVFAEEGVNVVDLQADLRARGLALIVSRNVTTRDQADRQQPFNLRVAGGGVQSLGAAGTVYDIDHLQIFQADQIRGSGLISANSVPRAGRRVLAQPLHDSAASALNLPNPTGPAGSVKLGLDGSMAAIVPAQRAMTWQLTDPSGTPVVRERYWVTFQPGEIRTCTSCHGVNSRTQAGQMAPQNKPEALRELLRNWKASQNP